MAQTIWKSPKYNYTVEIPENFSIRTPTGKNIDLSVKSNNGLIINFIIKNVESVLGDRTSKTWWHDPEFSFDEYFEYMEEGGKQYGLDIKILDYGETKVSGYDAFWYHQTEKSLFTVVYNIQINNHLYTISCAMPEEGRDILMPFWYRFFNNIKFTDK